MIEMTTDALYPRLPGDISPIFHAIAIPLFVLILVPSLLAISVVLLLALLLQLARSLLERIPGCARIGRAISAAFHARVARLVGGVLKDPRDEPILATAIVTGSTVYVLFVVQLIVKEIHWPLVIAFYAFLYGPSLRAFVWSFSSMHQEGHRPGGIFRSPSRLEKWTGNSLLYMFFAIPMGLVPHAAAHLQQHHRENTGPLDVYASARYNHANAWHFVVYMVRDVMYQQLLVSPYLYFKRKRRPIQSRSMIVSNLIYLGIFAAVALYSVPIALLYIAVPWLAGNILMGVIHWTQHAFYGGQPEPKDFMYNTVTLLEQPVNVLNEGYHVCHHHWQNVHWSESPALFERIRPDMKQAQCMVFRDLSVLGLFFPLMLRRFDFLAHKLEWWEPISHEAKVELIKRRVAPAPMHEHERSRLSIQPVQQSVPG